MALSTAPSLCAHCGAPLPGIDPGPVQCPFCGVVNRPQLRPTQLREAVQAVLSQEAAPQHGPAWLYPERPNRDLNLFAQAHPTIMQQTQGQVRNLLVVSVLAMSLSTLLSTVLLDCGSEEQNAVGGIWLSILLVAPVIGLWVLVQQGKKAPKIAQVKQEFSAQAIRCWGRIVSIDAAHRAVVDAFIARDGRAGAMQQAVGSRVNAPVTLDLGVPCWWMPAQARQVGHWCAFLLHPTDPQRSYVDAIASHRGEAMTTPEGQVLVQR